MKIKEWMPYGYTQTWASKDKYMVNNSLYSGKDPIRLGIIGLGGVAQGKHLPAIFRMQILGYPVKLISVCEINESVGKKIETLLNAKLYTNYEKMLTHEKLDAIEVLIPPSKPRGEIIKNALNQGLHVFTEKPLLYSSHDNLLKDLQEAKSLCKLAEKKRVILSVGFSKRFTPPYGNGKKIIKNGLIGKISQITAKMCQGWSKSNLLENQVCHIIDIMRFLLGTDYKCVISRAKNFYSEPNYPIDGLVALLEFQNGVLGTLCVNSTSPSLKPWERIEIFGDQKWLKIDDSRKLVLYDSNEGPIKTWEPVWPNTLLMDTHFSGFVGEITAFLNAVQGISDPITSGWDGFKALELAYALHLSYKTKKEVELPLDI